MLSLLRVLGAAGLTGRLEEREKSGDSPRKVYAVPFHMAVGGFRLGGKGGPTKINGWLTGTADGSEVCLTARVYT